LTLYASTLLLVCSTICPKRSIVSI